MDIHERTEILQLLSDLYTIEEKLHANIKDLMTINMHIEQIAKIHELQERVMQILHVAKQKMQ